MDKHSIPSLALIAMAALLPPAANAQLPAACASFPNNCLYSPGQPLNFASASASLTYRDATGDNRTVELYIRIPAIASGALPVVIWSPGAEITADPKDILREWSEATAQAGYVTITTSHARRDVTQWAQLCLALELNEETCIGMNPVDWDWPHDLVQVLDWLEKTNQSGPAEVRGRIDMNHIAVAGHGEGGNGAISLAGARRLLTTIDRTKADDFSDPRPVAVVSLSPQGPLNAGFFDYDRFVPIHSWMNVKRPVLTVTGSGDNNCNRAGQCATGDTPSRRRIVHDSLPAGDKYMLFVNSVKLSHDFIGSLDTAGCVAAGVAASLCGDFDDWLRSTVLAFLDATVRGRTAAQTWLRGGLIRPASSNAVEWQTK